MTSAPAHDHRRSERDDRRAIVALGLTLTLIVAAVGIFRPAVFSNAELRLYDTLLASREARTGPTPSVVLVGIDDASLAEYGQWPWPRYRLAMLLERLFESGASAVALDFLMPEPDRSAPEVIESERSRDLTGAAIPSSVRTGDSNSRRLADTMALGPTVLGYYVEHRGAAPGPGTDPKEARGLPLASPGTGQALPDPGDAPKLPDGMILSRSGGAVVRDTRPATLLRSLPELIRAAEAEGFTNAPRDVDGAIRRVPLLLGIEGSERPSLALAALLAASPQRALTLRREDSGTVLGWGPRRIPLDAQGNLLLDFRRERHAFVSARAVLAGAVPADSFTGRIVLVGASARGLGDQHLTPSGRMLDGLEINATVIDDILTGTTITRPDWAPAVEFSMMLLAGILSTALLARAGFAASLAPLLAGSAAAYLGARQLLVSQDLYLSPLLPIAVLVLVTSLGSLARYGIEARKVRLRTRELLEAQDEVIISMSTLASARDRETGGHIRRTQRYVEILARRLAERPGHRHLSPADVELLAKSAPLHDIGKVGIPDSVLQKPGRLTDEEFAVMKSHTTIGEEALGRVVAASAHPERQGFLDFARAMAASHHERWDGQGYPRGLAGEAIPLAGRLMAVADVYDALVSDRVYKKGFTPDEARRAIVDGAGTQFDPEVVAAFLAAEPEFVEIARRYADTREA